MSGVQVQSLNDTGLPSLSRNPLRKKTVKGSDPPPPIDVATIPWRGHGGRLPTLSSVEFDRQLDKICVWLETWTHDQRCFIIEGVLRRSNYSQFQFLFTTLQPILHRDFMYTAKTHFPAVEFLPVSTHTSRKLKEKLISTRQDDFYRVDSAHYRDDEEVRQQVRLPELPTGRCSTESLDRIGFLSFSSSPSKKARVTNPHRASIDRWVGDGSNPLYAEQPHIRSPRYIDMPVRRHIQDERGVLRHSVNVTQSANTVGTNNSSLAKKSISQHAETKMSLHSPRKTNSKTKDKNKLSLDLTLLEQPEEVNKVLDWYTNIWTDVKRNEFLHKFLLKLDARQHYFLSSFLAARQRKDFISLLPKKISLQILSYLSVRELLICCMVSRTWNVLANTNQLWKEKCDLVRLEVPVDEQAVWKQVYRENKFLRVNWNEGKCKMTDLKGHTDTVTCVIFEHDRLASGSLDKTIRVWDMKAGKCTHTLKGHVKGVWCLDFFTKYLLLSGSFDGTIRIWNLRTGKCTKTIIAHDGPIWAMVRHKDTLVTGSQDKTAKIWDINRCLLQNTLVGHTAAIFAVDMNEDGNLVITGSADKSVKIWNIHTCRCLRWISVSQTTSIMSVSYSQGYLACSYGETICLYKVEGPTKLLKKYQDIVNEHQKSCFKPKLMKIRIECLRLDIHDKEAGKGMIVSAGKDGRVKYWDINRDKSIQTFLGHKGEPVSYIYFDELRIASAAADNKIRIWDFNV